MAVYVNHARTNLIGTPQSQAKKRFGCGVIALEREPEVNCVPGRVDGQCPTAIPGAALIVRQQSMTSTSVRGCPLQSRLSTTRLRCSGFNSDSLSPSLVLPRSLNQFHFERFRSVVGIRLCAGAAGGTIYRLCIHCCWTDGPLPPGCQVQSRRR
jgi:hypothetical protein